MAGRCASMTHDGPVGGPGLRRLLCHWARRRVRAADLALSGNTIPRYIAVEKLQQALQQQGAFTAAGRKCPKGFRFARILFAKPGSIFAEYASRRRRRKRNDGFLRLALAVVLAVAAGGIARADDLLKTKIGVRGCRRRRRCHLRKDKGYFRRGRPRGRVEILLMRRRRSRGRATSGDVDFGITAFTAGLYNLAGKGR